jgi:AAA15 family ATPase/GTPase
MKKIDYVNVTNFQIWKDVTLELEDFNVIKGSSNSGKSSLCLSNHY